ncbi:hypothetical protein EW145_g6921 [Phellinidium pouzarii]|uniref:ASTRA-associated protein 1 n=1 Tax=Phellinidium pouzarii TaxID=167371 RepID=A0A4S4KRW6_9AGAM|nr:hypothetical protein EW145_g6921 [Phellinidium pouzarii]
MHAPSPSHILRVHPAHVNVVSFSDDNERLYSGDLSGSVLVTSTRTLRPIAIWKAHTDSILGVQEWASNIATHGRDNKLHVWTRLLAVRAVGDTASSPDLPTPTLCYSLDVNALNFCRFSLLSSSHITSQSSTSSANDSALVAVPNLVESSLADVWQIPSCRRMHAAIGKLEGSEMSTKEDESHGRGKVRTDHNIARYDLTADKGDELAGRVSKYRIKQAGNGGIALRSDGRVCAVGGWDGKIRLFSTKSFKSLGTLSYHTKSCQSVAFAHCEIYGRSDDGDYLDDEDDELTEEEKEERCRWLAAGGQDNRLTIWELVDFSKNEQYQSERA